MINNLDPGAFWFWDNFDCLYVFVRVRNHLCLEVDAFWALSCWVIWTWFQPFGHLWCLSWFCFWFCCSCDWRGWIDFPWLLSVGNIVRRHRLAFPTQKRAMDSLTDSRSHKTFWARLALTFWSGQVLSPTDWSANFSKFDTLSCVILLYPCFASRNYAQSSNLDFYIED